MRQSGFLSHPSAVLVGLFVTILWSSSWVLIKIGLEAIPPLTFAGLRYVLASIMLVTMLVLSGQIRHLKQIPRSSWVRLAAIGLFFYAVSAGTQFWGIKLLPAISVNLILAMTTIVVALFGIPMLVEMPSWKLWFGIFLSTAGAVIYFFPARFLPEQWLGIVIALISMLSTSFGNIFSRRANRDGSIPPLTVTAVSMTIGSTVLFGIGAAVEGVPPISLQGWGILLWLALVNSALAYTLWNRVMGTLTSAESSLLANSMIVQIPILAVIFLGETINTLQFIGMAIVAAGTVLVSWTSTTKKGTSSPPENTSAETVKDKA